MREEGYYWVKYKANWEIAFWCNDVGGFWEMHTVSYPELDKNIDKIDETPITRDHEK